MADQPEALPPDKQARTRHRPLPPGIEPLIVIDDLADILRCSRRLVERMRAAGKLPRPDLHVGRCPRWRVSTIDAWIEQGGRP